MHLFYITFINISQISFKQYKLKKQQNKLKKQQNS